MRWLLTIVVACLACPAVALAKPKVAIAPLDGDDNRKVADIVAEEVAANAKVIGVKATGKAIDDLGLSDVESARALKKLRTKLDCDVVIHGKVEREGVKRKVTLTLSGRAKHSATLELTFRPTQTKTFKKELRDQLERKLPGAEGEGRDEDTDEDDEPKKKVFDDTPKEKPADTDTSAAKHKSSDDDAPAKKPKSTDDDEPAKKPTKRVADSDTEVHKRSDDDRPRKHRHRDESGQTEAEARPRVTLATVFAAGGGAALRRSLTYDASSDGAPPSVGTFGFSGDLEAELYPAASDSPTGGLAPFGIVGAVRKTFGLSIAVPGSTTSSAIDQGHYEVGLRYRFVFGTTSLAVGASYWRETYLANRMLGVGVLLDMPDTDYSAVAPAAEVKFLAAPTVGVFGSLETPLMLSSGAITSGSDYGVASILAVAFQGGADIALGDNYGVRLSAVYEQIGLSFQMAHRGVNSATDRTMGATATLALFY